MLLDLLEQALKPSARSRLPSFDPRNVYTARCSTSVATALVIGATE